MPSQASAITMGDTITSGKNVTRAASARSAKPMMATLLASVAVSERETLTAPLSERVTLAIT